MILVYNPAAYKHGVTEQDIKDEDIANIFHAMKCRKEFLRKLLERGYNADFD